jgi:pSer/pThr/pTyr-binding forkhead associated (FHA) protein
MADKDLRGMLHLLVGGVVSEAIMLKKEVTVIGREGADVVLDDSEVSSQHCQIQILAGNYHLFDLNSTNGTFLNGQKILKCRIAAGDVLRVGNVEFKFALGAPEPVIPRDTIKTFEGVKNKVDGKAYAVLDLIREERARAVAGLRLEIEGQWADGSRGVVRVETRDEVVGRLSAVGRFERDEELSRRHARMSVNDEGQVVVEDLESTNGTFVNEERIGSPRVVSPTDVVRIGKTRFQLRTWSVD